MLPVNTTVTDRREPDLA